MPLANGAHLGPYQVLGPIGAGAMGEVYGARDERLGREVAIKILPASLAVDAERVHRFEREARATGMLNHPNILVIYDLGTHEGTPYLVCERLEGETLRQRLDRGPLAPRQAVELAAEVAAGLAAAHERGVVHRDLKPENLFLTRDGRLKILDFGLAKLQVQPAAAGDDESTLSRATLPGQLLGSPAYMSPEQVRGLPVDHRSDFFSLGAILHEMVAGRRPFAGPTLADTLAAVLQQEPGALPLPDSEESRALGRLIGRCLEKAPERRFQSALDLAFQLRELAVRLADAGTVESGAPSGRRGGRARAIDSIAVLPFVNETADPETDYLSDGISESIMHALSQLPRLRVMARSTVFRYKDRALDPLEVGRALGVRAVLAGRLQHVGETLVVKAELVDVENGWRLWGDQYRRRPADLLAVQEEIAREISDRLRFKLSGAERRRLRKQSTRDTAAYHHYLRGRFFWNRWTPEGMRTSIDFYQRAIETDPAYALAYAGLADSYAVLGNIKAVPPAEAFPRAKAAALKALEIDEELAEAHASLGFVRRFFDWDWPGAERSFARALALHPGYATGHRWYGQFLSGMGRHEEAIREVELALELDPLSIIIHTAVGDALFYARRYEEAVGYYRKALELDPDFLPGHSDLARALEHQGNLDEAIAEYEKAIALAGGTNADPTAGLANAYAVKGRREQALAVIEELKRLRTRQYVSPWALASIYARLGEGEAALDWLDRAYEEHDSTLVWVKVHPRFDALRPQPRFQGFLRRMGLE